jgi:transcriptional regulator with XRE-family HTH domain
MIEKYKKYYSYLGEAVRQVRTADTDFTQTQLAKRLGVKQSYISKIESGKIRLGIIEVREICMELNISLVEFAKKLESIIANDATLK